MTDTQRYLQPGWFTRNVFNRSIRRLTRMGVSVAGSRDLRVRGPGQRGVALHTGQCPDP